MKKTVILFGLVTLATCAALWVCAVTRLTESKTSQTAIESRTPTPVAPAAAASPRTLPESESMTLRRSMARHAARSTLLLVDGVQWPVTQSK